MIGTNDRCISCGLITQAGMSLCSARERALRDREGQADAVSVQEKAKHEGCNRAKFRTIGR